LPNKKAKQKKWDKKQRSVELKQRKRAKRLQLKELKSKIEFLEHKLSLANEIINQVDSTDELAKLLYDYSMVVEDKTTSNF